MSTSKQDAPVADASKKENSTKIEDMMDDSDIVDQEIFSMSTEDIIQRTRALDNEVRILRSESLRLSHEVQTMKDKIKENTEKVKVNKVQGVQKFRFFGRKFFWKSQKMTKLR